MKPIPQEQFLQIWAMASVLGLIPAVIAHRKGRSFGLWWIYGSMLFIVALFHSLLIKPKVQQRIQPATVEQPISEPVEAALPEGTKKCEHCGQLIDAMSMRCPVCKKEQSST
jgi:hypothetical protein